MYVCRNEGCSEVFKFRIQRDIHQNMCTFPSHGTRETVIAGFLKCDMIHVTSVRNVSKC